MITGVAFGLVAVKQIGINESKLMQLLISVAAWDLMHIPAAIILFLKQQQRKNPYLKYNSNLDADYAKRRRSPLCKLV